MTIASLRAEARSRLQAGHRAVDPREAALLLARALDRDQAYLYAHADERVEASVAERFRRWLARRLDGEPFAYVVGEREFYGRTFVVDRRVLIPRPETEHLVEAALEHAPAAARVADLATGSGCVGLTLALERGDLRVLAADISLAALAVARANRQRLGLAGAVPLVCCDRETAIALDQFAVVVCNPPYVDPRNAASLQTEVRDHEPPLALFANEGGLAFYRRLLSSGAFRAGCLLCLEIGADQLAPVLDHATAAGWRQVEVRADLASIPRIVVLEATPATG